MAISINITGPSIIWGTDFQTIESLNNISQNIVGLPPGSKNVKIHLRKKSVATVSYEYQGYTWERWIEKQDNGKYAPSNMVESITTT